MEDRRGDESRRRRRFLVLFLILILFLGSGTVWDTMCDTVFPTVAITISATAAFDVGMVSIWFVNRIPKSCRELAAPPVAMVAEYGLDPLFQWAVGNLRPCVSPSQDCRRTRWLVNLQHPWNKHHTSIPINLDHLSGDKLSSHPLAGPW